MSEERDEEQEPGEQGGRGDGDAARGPDRPTGRGDGGDGGAVSEPSSPNGRGDGGAVREQAGSSGPGGRDGGGAVREQASPSGSGEPSRPARLAALARVAVAVLGPILLTTAYFTVPFGALEPRHPVLTWLIVAGLLTLLAVGMVVTTSRALTDQSGRYGHPGLGILLLSWASILVFAAGYWAMATRHGQFVGLQTRLDALYFTGVTMATVGYGDVHPSGQVARAVVLVQLVYTFAFLVSGIAAVRTRARARRVRRRGGG